jgi:hypothetical protein
MNIREALAKSVVDEVVKRSILEEAETSDDRNFGICVTHYQDGVYMIGAGWDNVFTSFTEQCNSIEQVEVVLQEHFPNSVQKFVPIQLWGETREDGGHIVVCKPIDKK